MRNPLFLVLVLLAASTAHSANPKAEYLFQSQRKPGQVEHVVVHVKVGGETKFVEKGNTQREKMNLVCDLEYDEKTLDVPDATGGSRRSVRNYTVADASSDEFKPTLRPDRRLICAETNGQTCVLFSPLGLLTQPELDLIDVQANSLLWDQLLPQKAVAVNDAWKHADSWTAAMLGLDEVAKNDVQSRLREVTDKVARFEISGRVEGAIHGVTTQIEVKGRYRFDRRSHRIDWLALVIQENRDSSLVDDGIDASSVFQMTANQVDHAPELSNAALSKLSLQSSPEQTHLTYSAIGNHWQFDHDRRWHVFRDQNDSAVLRMIERGEALGQCNVSSLPNRAPDKVVSLDEFQADVRQALGKNFGEFVEASQRKDDDGQRRVLRVEVDGTASDLPIQWTYYHIADVKGRQVAFVFTVEKSLLERFADADALLVQSLRFIEPAATNKDAAKETAKDAAKSDSKDAGVDVDNKNAKDAKLGMR
jgi:hypothetical protein